MPEPFREPPPPDGVEVVVKTPAELQYAKELVGTPTMLPLKVEVAWKVAVEVTLRVFVFTPPALVIEVVAVRVVKLPAETTRGEVIVVAIVVAPEPVTGPVRVTV